MGRKPKQPKEQDPNAPINERYYAPAESRSEDAGSFTHDNRNKPGKKTTEDEETLDNVSVEDANKKDLKRQGGHGAFDKKTQNLRSENTNSSQDNA